jgi:hypothetical protein
VIALAGAPEAGAWRPDLAKYPLRVHVLASDETHMSERMRPGDSAACDTIDDILGAVSPNPGGPISLTGLSGGDPCSLHPEMVTGRLLNVQDYDPVFSGTGRADLVSPPESTRGIAFQYDNCSRVRVLSGFQSLPARWKRQGQTLEVLIPSDEVPVNGRPVPPVRCTFAVTLHDFVYLRLPTGRLVEVSQEVYWSWPALRAFLSGGKQVVQERAKSFTVSAHPQQ